MRYLLFALLSLSFCVVLSAQVYEKDYQLLIQQQMGGQLEVNVQSGRVDLVTENYAIEIEFANKWKQSIGQALWYGLQTNKTPGIILIKRDRLADNKYVMQLGSALAYAGLGDAVRVWVWPDDFAAPTTPTASPRGFTTPTAGNYWMTTSSKKRHNSACRYYQQSKGRTCGATEGIACGICGG